MRMQSALNSHSKRRNQFDYPPGFCVAATKVTNVNGKSLQQMAEAAAPTVWTHKDGENWCLEGKGVNLGKVANKVIAKKVGTVYD